MITPIVINEVKVYPYVNFQSIVDVAYRDKLMLFSANAEILSKNDAEFKAILNKGIAFPDGIGAVMALKKKGVKNAVKIPGCELWLEVVKTGYKNKTFYLVGSKQDVIETTVEKLKKEYLGINIINYRNGYIKTEEERISLINDIVKKKPDVVFIAMGMPMQEKLVAELYEQHKAVYMGLGGSFDVYSGNVKRAPEWWINHNLEWAYRLIKEPKRIKRQIHLVRFLALVKLGKI